LPSRRTVTACLVPNSPRAKLLTLSKMSSIACARNGARSLKQH
jgi:hypothetical protein